MKAIITGASSGIGKEFAIQLGNQGYDLILVARREDKLEEVKSLIKTNVELEVIDVSKPVNLIDFYEKYKDDNEIDLLINNAGFGLFGNFIETDLEKEIEMVDTNVVALHILTKLFVQKFHKAEKGRIINVASSAAFQPGPLMATYYATKSYVYNLSCAIYEELKKENSKVVMSVLCPGPVNTEFNEVAGVKFGIKPLRASDVVKYALMQNEKGKLIIIPGIKMKLGKFLGRFVPVKQLMKVTYKIQKKKVK